MKRLMIWITRLVDLVREVRAMPRVAIEIGGGATERAAYEDMVRRHRKFPLVRSKEIGVALAKIPDDPNKAFSGSRFHRLRGGVNKASRAGYLVRHFQPLDHLSEILEINCSSEDRQGRKMARTYVQSEDLEKWARSGGCFAGCFAPTGKLVAYVHYRTMGGLIALVRIIGHRDHLEQGVMYLLYGEVVYDAIRIKSEGRRVEWIMYDTMLGGSEGLAQFKSKLGFAPFWTRFRWKADAAGSA